MSKIETQICMRLHVARGYVMARCIGQDAEDIYGDTIVRIWETLRTGKFKKSGNLDAFICRVARSALCDYYKKKGRDKRTCNEQYISQCVHMVKGPEREYEASVENYTFLDQMNKLKTLCRKVVILLLFQNMKHQEIAYTLGLNRNTVSSLLFRARQELNDIHLGKVRERRRRK